VSGHIMYIFCL